MRAGTPPHFPPRTASVFDFPPAPGWARRESSECVFFLSARSLPLSECVFLGGGGGGGARSQLPDRQGREAALSSIASF